MSRVHFPFKFWPEIWMLACVGVIKPPDLRADANYPQDFFCSIRSCRLIRLKTCEPPPQVNFDLEQRSWHCLKVRSLESEPWWSLSERKHCAVFVSPSHSSFPLALLPTTCGLAVPEAPGIEGKLLSLKHIKDATQNQREGPSTWASFPRKNTLCLMEPGDWERKLL